LLYNIPSPNNDPVKRDNISILCGPILFSPRTRGSIKGKQFQDTFWAIPFILPIIKKKIITPTDHNNTRG
jgi:hypothetical protein